MLRLVLFLLLAVLVARAFWRLVDGIVEGATGGRRSPNTPVRGVHMERDPICGTYVVPNRAVTLAGRTGPVFFCSAACRDEYRARSSKDSGRRNSVGGGRA